MLRSRMRVVVGLVVSGLVLTLTGQGTAAAEPAAALAAGLSAGQASALQAKVDGYLATLAGRGKQVSPNQIDMGGAMLTVTVPGEERTRRLAPAARVAVDGCHDARGLPSPAAYGWFCAYSRGGFQGDTVAMYHCDNYFIPFYTWGSWENNQTPGTRPVLYFLIGGGKPPWLMPAAPSAVFTETVDWSQVSSITNC